MDQHNVSIQENVFETVLILYSGILLPMSPNHWISDKYDHVNYPPVLILHDLWRPLCADV